MPRSLEYGSYLEWHKEAFAKLDKARAEQVEELIKKGKFEEAITSADNVTEGGSCCKLLEKIGFEAAFDGDLKAVRRVLDSLKSKHHPSSSKIYLNLSRHFTG